MLFALLAPGQERSSRGISRRLLCDFMKLGHGKLQAEDGWWCSIKCSSALLAYKTEVAWELWSWGQSLPRQLHLKKKKVSNNQKLETMRREIEN